MQNFFDMNTMLSYIFLSIVGVACSSNFQVLQGEVKLVEDETRSTILFSGFTVIEWEHFVIEPEKTLCFSGLNENDKICNLINSKNPALIQGKLFADKPFTIESSGELIVDRNAQIIGAKELHFFSSNTEILGSIEVKRGHIEILADEIILSGAHISVADESDAGDIYIGKSKSIEKTALKVHVDYESYLSASAQSAGNGGSIVIWSENQTEFFGKMESRGGSLCGDGGLIEVSSKKGLICQGTIDRRAAFGKPGLLLLDPEADINIQATGSPSGNFGMVPPFTYTPSTTSNTILIGPGPGTLIDYLDQGDVTIQTTYGGAAGPLGGRITLLNNMIYSSPNHLTLLANGENLVIQAQLENSGQGTIHLEAPNGSLLVSPSSGNQATVLSGAGVSISNIGGDVLLQGGAGLGEKVILGDTAPLPPTGNFSLTGVGGDLIIQAGVGADTSASILTQAGTITISVGGDIILRSGPVAPSEAYISGIPGNAVTISCGGDLIMEKGVNDAADYMLIGNETVDPILLNIGGMVRMVGDIGFGGPVLATFGNITAMIGTDIYWESSASAKVVIFGQTSAHFTIGGMADLINPEIISDDFQILP